MFDWCVVENLEEDILHAINNQTHHSDSFVTWCYDRPRRFPLRWKNFVGFYLEPMLDVGFDLGQRFFEGHAPMLDVIIFHQQRFPWIRVICLTKPPFGVRSCEVAITWPYDTENEKITPRLKTNKYSENWWLIKWPPSTGDMFIFWGLCFKMLRVWGLLPLLPLSPIRNKSTVLVVKHEVSQSVVSPTTWKQTLRWLIVGETWMCIVCWIWVAARIIDRSCFLHKHYHPKLQAILMSSCVPSFTYAIYTAETRIMHVLWALPTHRF